MTLEPKPQAEPNVSSRDEFPRLVLKLIADVSPCTEPTLFIEAVLHDLQKFAPGTLVEFRKLLGQCVEKLQSSGYVRFDGKHFVIVATGKSEEAEILDLATIAEDIVELTDVVGTAEEEDILELTAEVQPPVSGPSHGPEMTREEIIAGMWRVVSET